MSNQITVVDEVKGTLARMKDEFKMQLPSHIPVEKFIAVAQMAVANNPYIASLDKGSLYTAFSQCAQDGLIPDGREAAILPFAGKAKYLPGVAGLCKKIRNSGEISVVDAIVVYDGDDFQSWVDEAGPHFKYVRGRGERGKKLFYFAYAIGKDKGVFIEEMSLEEMAAIKKVALQKLPADKQKNSPWNGPFESEMERKSVLRRLAKYRLPSSSDIQGLVSRDDEFLDDDEISTETVTQEQASAPVSLKEKMGIQKESDVDAVVVDDEESPIEESERPFVQGVIDEVAVRKSKEGEAKPWVKHGFLIAEKWLSTFDTNDAESLKIAMTKGEEVKIWYEENVSGDKVFYNITGFEILSQTKNLPI